MEKRMQRGHDVFASVAGMQNGRFVMPREEERFETPVAG
jgi:hypothetical protein